MIFKNQNKPNLYNPYGRSPNGKSGIYVSQIWAHCNLKCGSDEYLKKVDRQRMTSDCKVEIVTRFDTYYFFIESFKKQ